MGLGCQECGAQLRLGTDSCPLCGNDLKRKTREKAEPAPVAPEEYHDNVRQLREELKRLRGDDAEAV